MQDLLIKHAEGYIAVSHGIIQAIGPIADCPPESQYKQVEYRPHCLAMPGFVNGHTHAAMSLLRGLGEGLPLDRWLHEAIFPAEDKLSEEAVYWGAKLSFCEMLAGGTTQCHDMYFYTDAVARAAADTGLRAELSRGLMGTNDAEFDARMQENLDFASKWHNSENGRITVGLGPHAEYTSTPEQLKRVAKEDLPIHIHCAETLLETQGCRERHGCSPVEYFAQVGILRPGTRLAHCVHTDAKDWQIIKQNQGIVAHCPGSNLKLGSGIMPFAAMVNAGINIQLGTDGPASDDRQDMFRAAWLAAVLTQVTADKTLEIAASYHALEPGAPADIALINTNTLHNLPSERKQASLLFTAGPSDVALTVVDGIIRYKDGSFPGVDIEEVKRMACKHAKLIRGGQ